MSRIKGAAIRARLEFVRDTHGEDALQRVLGSLGEMDRHVLDGTMLPSLWYPAQVLARFDEAACRLLADGDTELFEKAGAAIGVQHAGSIYRVFFGETDPVRVLRLASAIHANYYSGLGRVSLLGEDGGDHGRVIVRGAEGSSRSNCLSTLAYFRSVVESCTGMTVVAREARCTHWGDEDCEFEFRWPRQEQLKRATG